MATKDYFQYFATEEDAKEFIESELKRWHPAGYGTHFDKPKLKDGQWLVTGSRSTSSD